ncbi:IS66 family transposase zinc-finger binding domain-containing protein [Microcoleus sp. w1-18aA5]|uniref:IS66 family transposase zinc-finger binding domain-containing protein n=1 Tax=Microcoleus sp. w1-18aA5 TaxID=2818982 RepID=UPI002FD0BB94
MERQLHPEPDQTIIAQIKNCPQCGEKLTAAAQKLQSLYEKTELPPIRPIVTRIERYDGQCACCQTEYVAPVPLGMEPGSPFGRSIQSSRHISSLHSCHQLRTAVVDIWRVHLTLPNVSKKRENEKASKIVK